MVPSPFIQETKKKYIISMTSHNPDISVRASHDGHEYHIAWAANVSLKLIVPNTDLTAVAIEGFTPKEAEKVSGEAMDIADLIQYYGGRSFSTVHRLEILQFKYSPTHPDKDLTASDLQKTLGKFVSTQNDIEKEIGYQAAIKKTSFQFVCNKPIGKNLEKAFDALKRGKSVTGHVRTQVESLQSSIRIKGKRLISFLDRFSIIGENTSRAGITGETHRILSRLTGSSDPIIRLKLLELQNLLRQKAGCDGAPENCVTLIDVLGVLGIDHPKDLYPAPCSFPKVFVVLDRPFSNSLSEQILSSVRPYIIHGPGGIGKTVVMQSLGQKFSVENEVILFDGFGGGSWRAPSDNRHLARISLLHIVNTLAAKNLCDLILPGGDDYAVLRTAVKRLCEAARTLRENGRKRSIILLLDAIDHAGMRAESTNSKSFAKELLQELDCNPIEGVIIVASCRTERRKEACGFNNYPDFLIPAFSDTEIRSLAQKRSSHLTPTEEAILISKSGGNPRCLDMMLKDGDLKNTPTVGNNVDLLDALLEKRFEQAIQHADEKGSFGPEGKTFIASLRLLPPPVPVDELASILGIAKQAVESFVSDLYPLIENTKYGLLFRDEPTETLAKKFADKVFKEVDPFVQGLKEQQSKSVYCARALPNLLVEFNKSDDLIELAYSDIFPEKASSTVARRNIKLARISAAINGCVKDKRYDDIFTLFIEASTIASGTKRSDRYVLDFPDLAIASDDIEVQRRVFESKTAWNGARISSQSLAYALSNFHEEATSTGYSAIEWLNWGLGQVDKHESRGRLTKEKDWYGAIYIMLLNGDLDRILNWLDKRDFTFAYNFLTRIFNFLVLHAKESEVAQNSMEQIVDRACNGLISSYYCLCAIILRFQLSVRQERKIISILAERTPTPDNTEEHFYTPTKKVSLNETLLLITIRAIKNRQRKEAKEIFLRIICTRPRNHEYGYGAPYAWNVSFWVLYSAVHSVLKNKRLNVGDFIPEEVWEKLPKSALSSGPKKIDDALKNLFAPNKRKKAVIDYRRKNELERTIKERCKPLMEIAEWTRGILQQKQSDKAFEDRLDDLDKAVRNTSNYPYQDQTLFVATIGFFSIFNAVNQMNMWKKGVAERYVKWLESSPIKNHSNLTEVVSELASQLLTQRAALQLCTHTNTLIKKETDTQTKIDNLADLARAIWYVSKREAGEIFKQGIELADKLGSQDYFEVEALIHCAQAYNGNTLPHEVVHDFNRICELNFGEETEKFIWTGYGKALAKIGGVGALAIVSRLADRDVASLEYSLGPLLSSLVESEKIPTELACPLIGLDDIAETWTWDLSVFFEPTLTRLSQEQKKMFAVWLAREYDRTYANAPPKRSLFKLKKLLVEHQIRIPNYSQFDYLGEDQTAADKKTLKETIDQFGDTDKVRPINFDPTDFEALNQDIATELRQDSRHPKVWRRLASIIESISAPDDILTLTAHISELDGISLKDVLQTYETIRDEWGDVSGAVHRIIEEGTLKALTRDTSAFFVADWRLGSLLRDICTFTPNHQKETLCRILKALGNQQADLESSQWMRFAAAMSNHVSDQALEKGLKIYIKAKGSHVPLELGDNVWSAIYEPPASTEDVVSTFLWNQLGSPSTNLRWRAAHAVIRYVEFGRLDIIEKLFKKFEAERALPFHHPQYPFYYLHARLWFLIALSKIARETPLILKPYSATLLEVAKACGNHCLLKFYAVATLKRIQTHDPKFSFNKELAEQEKQITPIGIIEQDIGKSPRADSFRFRPDDAPKPKIDFHFYYDFKEHEIDSLASRFGMHTWQVADQLASIIAEWDFKVSNSSDCPRGLSSSEQDYNGQQPYGYYLGYHALFVAAGKYLKEQPVIKGWYDDTWEDWLSPYTLTDKWLSDYVDYFPPELQSSEIDLETVEGKVTLKERKSLAALISNQKPFLDAKEITISGRWSDKNNVEYTVSSAFIAPMEGRNLAYALMMQTAFFNYLPLAEYDYGDPWKQLRRSNPLSPIVAKNVHEIRKRLDEYDPYGISGAEAGPDPTEEVVLQLDLSFSNEEGKNWINNIGATVFSKRIWGANFGQGRHRHSNYGELLNCSLEGLKPILRKRKESLIILVCAKKYHENRERERKFENKSAVVLVDSNGTIQVVQRVPTAVKDAAEIMHPRDRTDVIDCYRMVLENTGKS